MAEGAFSLCCDGKHTSIQVPEHPSTSTDACYDYASNTTTHQTPHTPVLMYEDIILACKRSSTRQKSSHPHEHHTAYTTAPPKTTQLQPVKETTGAGSSSEPQTRLHIKPSALQPFKDNRTAAARTHCELAVQNPSSQQPTATRQRPVTPCPTWGDTPDRQC